MLRFARLFALAVALVSAPLLTAQADHFSTDFSASKVARQSGLARYDVETRAAQDHATIDALIERGEIKLAALDVPGRDPIGLYLGGQRLRPVFDCKFSAGGWSYSAASFTAPGTGCVVSFSQTTLTTMFGADGLLTYGPNNLLTHSNSFSSWSKSNVTLTTDGGVPDPFGGTTASTITAGASNGQIFQQVGPTVNGNAVSAIWARLRSGNGSVTLKTPANGSGLTTTLTGVWQQLSTHSAVAAQPAVVFQINTNGDAIDIYAPTLSAVTHETTPRSQDQVITGASAYDGPRLDYNPATLAVNGLLIEQASANEEPNARDMTQASWTKGATITVAHTATGIDGVAISANLITGGATTATNTVCGALTITSEAQTGSFYIEPVTVTGAINISINGGSTWTNIAGSLISSKFVRPSAEATLANPSLCVQIANNNDQIIVDANQVEDLAFPTSFIPTGASQVSRAADVATATLPGSQSQGSAFLKYITPKYGNAILDLYQDGSNKISDRASTNLFLVNVGGTTQYQSFTPTITANAITSDAFGWALNNFDLARNGTLAAHGASGSTFSGPAPAKFGTIDNTVSGVTWIQRFAYWPQKLSASKLQAKSLAGAP